MKVQRSFIFTAVFSLFITSCGLLSLVGSESVSARPLSACSTGLLVAHRGYEPGKITENTFKAFTRAIGTGARTIETDIHVTKDKEWVLMHDPTTGRTTKGKNFWVSKLNVAQVKSLRTNDGVKGGVPELKETLRYLAARTSLRMQIEIKPKTTDTVILKKVLDYLKYYKVQNRVTIISFHGPTLKAIRNLDTTKTLSTGLITTGAVSPATAKAYGTSVIMHQRGVSAALVNNMHNAGVKVYAWTVNNRAGWSRVVSAGVDGVTTDKPATLNKYCRAARR